MMTSTNYHVSGTGPTYCPGLGIIKQSEQSFDSHGKCQSVMISVRPASLLYLAKTFNIAIFLDTIIV